MEKHQEALSNKKRIFLNNFIGGISWGLGATIGVTIIVAVITYVLRTINLVPFLGNIVTQVTAIVLQNLQSTPYLLK